MSAAASRLVVLLAGALACGADGGHGSGAMTLPPLSPTISSLSGQGELGGLDDGGTDGTTAASTGGEAVLECMSDAACPEGQVCAAASRVCLPAGRCALAADCPPGQICPEGVCMPGDPCAAPELARSPAPARVLALVHRGESMAQPFPGGQLGRWDTVKAAIDQLALAAAQQGGLGLGTFSACVVGQACAAGTIAVPIAGDNAAAIQGFLADKIGKPSPDGAAPDGAGVRYLCGSGEPENAVGKTLQALTGEPSLQAPGTAAAVVVVTDGPEVGAACTYGGGLTGAIAADALRRQAVPVRSFAVGFGEAPLLELDRLAEAGGSGRARLVGSAPDLLAALQAIFAEVAQCSFVLAEPLPDGVALQVFLADEPAPLLQDPVDSWQYDPNTRLLWLAGAACARVRAGDDLDVRAGCPLPAPGS